MTYPMPNHPDKNDDASSAGVLATILTGFLSLICFAAALDAPGGGEALIAGTFSAFFGGLTYFFYSWYA